MTGKLEISKEEFLNLPTEEIRKIVLEKKKPRFGIFVADGNRRLVMCRTRLSPTSDEFYAEYARFFADSLRDSLDIFFNHGLETLFFPLFGPSLLLRQNKFQSITIPSVYQKIFRSDEWFQFYKENGIRIKAYGDLTQLEKIDVKSLNMVEGITHMIEKTESHKKHTVFFGFMSENTPGFEMPQLIIDFYKTHHCAPTSDEAIKIYYGEIVPPVDFSILSARLYIRALPPLISVQTTKIYYLPVPGFLGLNISNYRKILYDLLYLQPHKSVSEYPGDDSNYIELLNSYYEFHKGIVIGTVKRNGNFLVPDLEGKDK